MAKPQTCYFTLTYGLQGCYMPDSHFGPYAVTTRSGITYAVRETLSMLLGQEGDKSVDSCMRQVSWKRLWAQAKRSGTSSIHFCIATSDHNMLEFHGLTQEGYEQAEKEQDQ